LFFSFPFGLNKFVGDFVVWRGFVVVLWRERGEDGEERGER